MTPPAARRVLAVARSQLGNHEKPFGSNNVKYNTAYYGRSVHNTSTANYAWCVVFQWWCMQRAEVPTSVFPKSASVFAVRDWYKARGRFDRHPRVGSLVIFSFSHIGIVEKVLPNGRIRTIEGNTDTSGGRTGGKVMRKIRSAGIQGYCHPAYEHVAAASRQKPRAKPAPAVNPVPARNSAPGAPVRAVKTTSSAVAARHEIIVPAHTALTATNVSVRAQASRPVQFSQASANTAGFWAPPRANRRGYNLATGPGLFVAQVTLQTSQLPAGAELSYRLVQTDPARRYAISTGHEKRTITALDPPTTSATTVSRLMHGQHLWLEVACTHDVVLPVVHVEAILLSVT